ncbi:glycine-rich domain-containing protein [Roseovarius sp. 10]|uniref:glycine-rich domain-containing protein n=1 Tax=Roseovarius sp. 10 TaxID=3080563 RepID=UPI002953D8FB|nr:hypothetical protein [Roseovarius sp. 10]
MSLSFPDAAYGQSLTGGSESIITVDGVQYRVHKFTADGVLNNNSQANSFGAIEYLVVAGGGGGGVYNLGGGGGGAGQFMEGTIGTGNTALIPMGNIDIKIGAGGAAGTSVAPAG